MLFRREKFANIHPQFLTTFKHFLSICKKHSQNDFVCKNNVFESFQNFFLIQKQQKTIFQRSWIVTKEVFKKKFQFLAVCEYIKGPSHRLSKNTQIIYINIS